MKSGFFRDFLSAVERQDFGRPWLESPGLGLDEYRTNYDFTMRDALRSVYSTFLKCVPPADFDALARRYIDRHPPDDWDINRYGRHFPEWLEAEGEGTPFLVGIAALDRAIHFAHFAPPQPHLDPARLAALPPASHPGIRLIPHEATRLVTADFPLTALYNDPGTAHPARPDGPAEQVIVSRDATGEVHVRVLPPGPAAFVGGTFEHETLEACLDRAFDVDPAFDLPDCLRRGMEDGFWSGFDG